MLPAIMIMLVIYIICHYLAIFAVNALYLHSNYIRFAMLIEFKCRNIFSFMEETSFLMTQVKSFKELLEHNVIPTEREFDLLKAAAIYGANGSGKSNFIAAVVLMNRIIDTSFSDSLKKDKDKEVPNDFQFRLNTATEKEATMFEVSFLMDNYIYRYGFEILIERF